MIRINNSHKEFFIKRKNILVSIVLIMTTFAVYWQVIGHDFINIDDDKYVYENRHVQNGLSFDDVLWAFTSTHASNWFPLTWISHMIDGQLYGLNPGMHHVTSLIIHTLNCLLLFLVLNRMTGSLWQSAMVAALFGLHPINVDSVAWIAERKNILSIFFGMLTVLSYTGYVKRPGTVKYLLTLTLFALSLMAKPMLVTLPFVLLLIDYWPLGRVQSFKLSEWGDKKIEKSVVSENSGRHVFQLVLEKIPFLALSAVSVVISTLIVQQNNIVMSTKTVPMNLRIANALVSYVGYMGKMVWPANLAVIYPFPITIPIWKSAGAFLLLASITVFTFRKIKSKPYLGVGWLWYVGTLVPFIGLTQAGLWPAMADRWAYMSFLGLFICIVWGVPDLLGRWPHNKKFLTIFAILLLSILITVTWKQLGHWKNSITLLEHAINVTSNNGVAHNNLGTALVKKGRIDDAIKHFRQAVRINSGYEEAHYNLGTVLVKKGRIDDAIKHFQQALRIDPGYEEAHNNLGIAFYHNDDINRAIEHFQKAIEINPHYTAARDNLKQALILQKQNQ